MLKTFTKSLILFSFILISPALADDVKLDVENLKNAVRNIYTGGQPSLDDIKSLKEKGFTLIVNVRGKAEYADWDKFDDFDEAAEARKAGIGYVSIPFKGMEGLTKENAAKLYTALRANMKMRGNGKVLLHCKVGMRAGALLALHEFYYKNLSKEEAIQLAVDANTERNRDYATKAFKDIEK